MEGITDLLVSLFVLAVPVVIFFVGFFIIFGETFRIVNALFSLRFADTFATFMTHNEGYPFTAPPKKAHTVYDTLTYGGFAYTEYTPVKSGESNILLSPEIRTYYGVLDGRKVSYFEENVKDYGYDYIRKRFSLGHGYDIYIEDIKKGLAVGVYLPNLVRDRIGNSYMTLKYPVHEHICTLDEMGGESCYDYSGGTGDTTILNYEDYSSSGLITNKNMKNSLRPPDGFISAPVITPDGKIDYDVFKYIFYVNGKIYKGLDDFDYFHSAPEAEVYVEVLTFNEKTESDTFSDSKIQPEKPLTAILVVSISRWVLDYSKVGKVQLIVTYRYGNFNWATDVISADPTSTFFIIPLDYTKSITDEELKDISKFEDKIRLYGTVTYDIQYDGKDYMFTTKFLTEVPTKT